MAITSLNSVVSILQSAGVTGTALSTAISGLFAASPTTAINATCQVILANSNNPTVVKDEAMKLGEIPNLPLAVANLIPSLTAANSAPEVVQAVQNIETAIGPNHSIFNL
jgi:hypothetical protein